jgi:hypothetical protein
VRAVVRNITVTVPLVVTEVFEPGELLVELPDDLVRRYDAVRGELGDVTFAIDAAVRGAGHKTLEGKPT